MHSQAPDLKEEISSLPFPEDVTLLLLSEFFDFPTRYRFGQTCRAAFGLFALNLQQYFKKALLTRDFQSSNDLELHELEQTDIMSFLEVLRYPYAQEGEKAAYRKWLNSPEIQAKNSITFWRVAIFCYFLLHDIQVNKLSINQNFVTAENFPLFKELIREQFDEFGSLEIDPDLLDRLTQLPAVQAQPLLRNILQTDFINFIRRKPFDPLLLLIDLGFVPATQSELTAEELTRVKTNINVRFQAEVIKCLKSLYFKDRRTAKWASGVLRSSSVDDRRLLRNCFVRREGGNDRDRFVQGVVTLQYLSKISPDCFPQAGDRAVRLVTTAKTLLFDLMYSNPSTSAAEANQLCLQFTSPLFLEYVCTYMVNKTDHRADLDRIINNSLHLLSAKYWKQSDWSKLSSAHLKLIEMTVEEEVALCNRLNAHWVIFPSRWMMGARMQKLAYAFRPDSLLWGLPEELVRERIRALASEAATTTVDSIPLLSAALDPASLIKLSEDPTALATVSQINIKILTLHLKFGKIALTKSRS